MPLPPAIACHCCTEKTQYRKFETNITRKGIARSQSQFPHSCVGERFIYSHDRSDYSAAGKYVGRSWEYINRPQTHECGIEAAQFLFWEYINWISLQCVYAKCFKKEFRAGIFKNAMGARHRVGIGLSYRPARLHRLAELMHGNRFLGSINV